MSSFEIAIPDLFRFEPVADSPDIGSTGLRIAAGGTTWDGHRLRFDLLVAWQFPDAFVESFAKLTNAFVFVVEDAALGACFADRAVDPHKDYLVDDRPSWNGAAQASAASGSSRGGWLTIPIEVAAGPPPWEGPSVFASVVLHDQLSNTLGFDLGSDGPRVASWLAGAPFDPRRYAETEASGPLFPEPPPPTASPSLALAPLPGTPLAFEARLSLTPAELAQGGPEGWLRSAFVRAISRTEQLPFVASWLGERVVMPGDVEVTARGGLARLPFELGKLFGDLPPDTYDVHVTARHHCSPILSAVVR